MRRAEVTFLSTEAENFEDDFKLQERMTSYYKKYFHDLFQVAILLILGTLVGFLECNFYLLTINTRLGFFPIIYDVNRID